MSTLISQYFDRLTFASTGIASGGVCLLKLLTIQMIADFVSESVTGIFYKVNRRAMMGDDLNICHIFGEVIKQSMILTVDQSTWVSNSAYSLNQY